MTFNNIDFTTLGIIPQFINGILDMPQRKGDTFYDWGDEIEPLVSADDIYFGSRDIVLDAFFDERKGTWEHASDSLEGITTTQTLITVYGEYQVKLDSINIVKSYKGGKTLRIIFKELNPDLSGGLPTTSGYSGVRIDGYDLFTNFGLLVENVKNFEIPQLTASRQTTYKSNALSRYRQPPEIDVKVSGIYASKAEMTTKINQLNALLAKEGLRHFVHKGKGFQCYMTEGYKVDITRLRVSVSLKLKVMAEYNIEAIIQEVLNRIELEARPQSDLAVTDDQSAAFVKNKDTFKAADSGKLNGQAASYYAKDSDVSGLRSTDFAALLEQATPDL